MLAVCGGDLQEATIPAFAHLLRDVGIEVIYLGGNTPVDGIVSAVLAEDADPIGIGVSPANQVEIARALLEEMWIAGVLDAPVMLNGQIGACDGAPRSRLARITSGVKLARIRRKKSNSAGSS